MVWIHGGGWRGGSKNRPAILEITRHGFALASISSADDPPLLIFHGEADRTVLPDQSQHIARLYSDVGLKAKLVILRNAGHGGRVFFKDEHFEQALRFLNSCRPL